MLIFKRIYIDTVSKESFFFQRERDKKNEIKDLKHECILGARSAIDALAQEAQEAQIPFNPYL